jgi:hypothetical protein
MPDLLAPRSDWTLTPPDDSGTWEPYAYIVGGEDGIDMYWIRKDSEDPTADGPESDDHRISWPFGDEDIAHRTDLEALGFRVES